MKIFSSKQIAELDKATIVSEPVLSIDLMERASNAFVDEFKNFISPSDKKTIKVFAGPGNNGGDALAIARILSYDNYSVRLYIVCNPSSLSDDAKINISRLQDCDVDIINLSKYASEDSDIAVSEVIDISENDIIIDGIFGSGLSRKVDGFYAHIIESLNSHNVEVFSIDIPSGLFGEDNSENTGSIIEADHTFSFQFYKLSSLFKENYRYYGDVSALDIGLSPEHISKKFTQYYYLEGDEIKYIFNPRKRYTHKGSYGHALLVSGSYGKFGASVLAAKAAMRSGTGLLTVHLPKKGVDIMQISLPEAMVSADTNEEIITECDSVKYSAIGVGPGIGTEEKTHLAFKELLLKSKTPLVIDADALNILSSDIEMLDLLPEESVLTPHPKEFERIFGKTENSFEKIEKAKAFAMTLNIYIVLKDAITSVVTPQGDVFFNSTGNAGMATAGSGDALTGIITALMSQNYDSLHASVLGVYIHGLAGDMASEKYGKTSMVAGDIVEMLPQAFLTLEKSDKNYN